MIKLYTFESAEDLIAYEARESKSAPVQPVILPAEPQPRETIVTTEEHRFGPAPVAKEKKKPIKGKGYKKGVCGKCGKEGHNAWKCPERKASKPRKQTEKRVYTPPEVETQLTKKTPDELRQEVQDLQREGKSSLQIAQQLKISLREVNEYWDPDIAVAQGREEEEEDQG